MWGNFVSQEILSEHIIPYLLPGLDWKGIQFQTSSLNSIAHGMYSNSISSIKENAKVRASIKELLIPCNACITLMERGEVREAGRQGSVILKL